MSEQTRAKVESILADRWSLDQEDGWEEFGPDTLDDIERVYAEDEATRFTDAVYRHFGVTDK